MIDALRSPQNTVYLRLVARWWWLPILFAFVSATVTYVGTNHYMKTTYSSSVMLQVMGNNTGPNVYSSNDASSDALLLTTLPVLQTAAKKLDPVARRDPSALFSTECQSDPTNRFITCTNTSSDPGAAAAALNDLVVAFVKYNLTIANSQFRPSLMAIQQQEHQIKREIRRLQTKASALQAAKNPDVNQQYQATDFQGQITQDETSLSQLTVQESSIKQQMTQAASAIRIVNPALPNPHATGPHPMRNALLGMFIGIGMAGALIILLEFLDDRFRFIGEVSYVTGVRVLGAIRPIKGTARDVAFVALQKPRSAASEAYRVARTNIQFASAENPVRVLVVSSPEPGEGKTTSAINLAVTMALAGRRVLLVDADLHQRTLSHLVDLADHPGLSTILSDVESETPGVSAEAINLDVPHILDVVPAGETARTELLGSLAMQQWLDEMRRFYDMVIIDAPPILSLADGRAVSTVADGVVVVIDPSISSRRQARETQLALDTVGANLLGIIVNRTPFHGAEAFENYSRKALSVIDHADSRAL